MSERSYSQESITSPYVAPAGSPVRAASGGVGSEPLTSNEPGLSRPPPLDFPVAGIDRAAALPGTPLDAGLRAPAAAASPKRDLDAGTLSPPPVSEYAPARLVGPSLSSLQGKLEAAKGEKLTPGPLQRRPSQEGAAAVAAAEEAPGSGSSSKGSILLRKVSGEASRWGSVMMNQFTDLQRVLSPTRESTSLLLYAMTGCADQGC